MPLQQTSGNVTADAYGGGVAVLPKYIEEYFSTFLYTGTGASRTITNGIDLSTNGGLIWIKDRTAAANHCLVDTVQGITKNLVSNTTAAAATVASGDDITSFTTSGWTFGNNNLNINNNGDNFASWTFAKAPKFFDVVTYTGTGSNRTIAHNLGSVPGCILVKRTDTTGAWQVYHRSLANTEYLVLNTTAATATGTTRWNSTTPTSTVFSLGTDASVNASGGTYVAYIYAHDSGGFGLTGTDNVISCGSFTTDGSGNASVNLGYEPQFWLYKPTISARYWTIYDVMRGWSQTYIANLNPNVADAEGGGSATLFYPTATGFDCVGSALDPSTQHIYIAIRRGPMKVPTDATKVYTGSLANPSVSVNAGFVPDLSFSNTRDVAGGIYVGSRLQGSSVSLNTYNSAIEAAFGWVWNGPSTTWMQTTLSAPVVDWLFARAPSVCDVVCYTGSGSNTTKNHNLGAVPELIILKGRDAATPWACYSASLANTDYLVLRTTAAAATDATYWNSTTPTSSVFSIGTNANVNTSAATYVAYLFASTPGVSKCGSYTGNGTTQTINCGFTGGARWVMIKRTDSTGSWYVYDTARGMTILTDPYLLMNSNAAEVATLGSVTTVSTGFALNSTILAAINISAASYIFLAIA